MTWFPPLTGGSSQKRNNQSRFGPGSQGEPSIVTNFTKRRKVQVIESEILDSASLLQFASLTQPCSQAHVSLTPGAAGEGDQPQEEKDKKLVEEPEPEVGARPWPWLQRGHHGGGLLASSRELWRLLNPNMPGIQPRNRGAAQRADSARRARRSNGCLTGRGVSFMSGPEGETGQ